MRRKPYQPPIIRTEKLALGVFGEYGADGGGVQPFLPVFENTDRFDLGSD